MRGITELAADAKQDLGENFELLEAEKWAHDPFLFIVCGEVNSGKSTLLNALFGRDICRVNVLPETDRIIRYQYDGVPKSVMVTPVFEERHLPMQFLKNFSIVDTPGTNLELRDDDEIIPQFIDLAELILCVFPVVNPWSGPTWNLLSTLSPESLKRVVLIIQQADQRDSADIKVTLGHLADLAMKRLGQVPPIFAVSAKLAYEAKRINPPPTQRLRISGFVDLERHISNNICESPARKEALADYSRQVGITLRKLEDRIEDQARALNMQGRFLDTVEREIDASREGFVARLTHHLDDVAEVFEREAVWGSKLLEKRLAILPSFGRLFVGDRTGPVVEAAFLRRLQIAVGKVAEKDAAEIVDFCRNHWDDLGERVKEVMAVDLGKSDQLDSLLTAAKDHFMKCVSSRGIDHLKVRAQLDKDLRHRNLSMKSFTVMTLLCTIIGSTCGALDVPWAPLIFCSLAGLFLIGGIYVSTLARKKIVSDFQESLLATCGSFASTLRADYEEALRVMFQDYAASLTAVRSYLVGEKKAVEPRLKRWKELFLTLKAIEQDL